MLTISNFIDGSFLPTQEYINNYNPSTGKVPESQKNDVNIAVEAAERAFVSWSQTSRRQRSAVLNKIADVLESRLEEFAQAESKDQGKPVSLAREVDIPRAVYNFRYFAGRILYWDAKKTELDGVAMNYTQSMPIGVAGLISPWNLPLYLLTWKIAPCIAAGNTCVCKPSEFTSVTAWMLCSVLNDAGLPNGVVNMVFGTGQKAGSALVQHPRVPLISFTGGTATGEIITRDSAPHFKKLSLELGGKNAAIIFEDASFPSVITTTVRSSFTNQGEICLCTSRLFVHASIYHRFLSSFLSELPNLFPVGDPSLPETKMGPLVSGIHLKKVLSYVDIAVQEGGRVLCGGQRVHVSIFDPADDQCARSSGRDEGGYFMAPTVIATHEVSDDGKIKPGGMDPMTSRLLQEEIFGPVVTVTPFTTEEEVIKWTNSTKYGLSATLWTENGRRQRRVAEQLRVGTVWVNSWMVRDLNMPFGGMKQSGIGREGSDYSLEFFTETKTICLAN